MNDHHSNDPFDELMRRSLAEEANRIEPTDALPEILTQAHAVRRPVVRRAWVMTAGLAAVGTAAAVGAFTVFNGHLNSADEGDAVAGQGTTTYAGGAPTTPPDTPRQPTTATQPPTTGTRAVPGKQETKVSGKTVPVYWLGNSLPKEMLAKQTVKPRPATTRLYRTWSKVSGRPAYEAVQIMTRSAPADRDYYSLWRGAALSSVTLTGDVVVVDFKELPQFGAADAESAEMAAQQLVYTVQGALDDTSQAILVTRQGQPVGKLFGHVNAREPLTRAQALDVQALVSIDSPTEGLRTTSPVTLQGTAAAYEGTVNYIATNLKTKEIKSSIVNTKEGQKLSEFTIQLNLGPGPWQIEAYLVSAEDNAGITDMDTKTIDVVSR